MVAAILKLKNIYGQVGGWVDGWPVPWENSTTPWTILQAETCQIFSWAEIARLGRVWQYCVILFKEVLLKMKNNDFREG